MLKIEKKLWEEGYNCIACIDEVGRGCLAGNVTACAIIMPKNYLIDEVDDSKKLSEKKRNTLFDIIKNKAIAIGIGEVDNNTIDNINIKNATHLAMIKAIENLKDCKNKVIYPDFLLIDAEKLKIKIPQLNIVKGDSKCHGIAAASIIAKVTRDRKLIELDKQYPMYKFAKNKGYGTKEHIKAIKTFGITPLHRNTFLKKILDEKEQLSFG